MKTEDTIVLAASLVFFAEAAPSEESSAFQFQSVKAGSSDANDTNAANNPLESLLKVDVQSRFVPSPERFPGRIGNQKEAL